MRKLRDDLREAGDRVRDRFGGYAEAPNFHLDGDSGDDHEDRISESESKLFRSNGTSWMAKNKKV